MDTISLLKASSTSMSVYSPSALKVISPRSSDFNPTEGGRNLVRTGETITRVTLVQLEMKFLMLSNLGETWFNLGSTFSATWCNTKITKMLCFFAAFVRFYMIFFCLLAKMCVGEYKLCPTSKEDDRCGKDNVELSRPSI